MDKKLIGEMEGNKETANFIRLEFLNLSLEINLEEDLFYIKYCKIF